MFPPPCSSFLLCTNPPCFLPPPPRSKLVGTGRGERRGAKEITHVRPLERSCRMWDDRGPTIRRVAPNSRSGSRGERRERLSAVLAPQEAWSHREQIVFSSLSVVLKKRARARASKARLTSYFSVSFRPPELFHERRRGSISERGGDSGGGGGGARIANREDDASTPPGQRNSRAPPGILARNGVVFKSERICYPKAPMR